LAPIVPGSMSLKVLQSAWFCGFGACPLIIEM